MSCEFPWFTTPKFAMDKYAIGWKFVLYADKNIKGNYAEEFLEECCIMLLLCKDWAHIVCCDV
jgi:hypothetical protein